MRAALYSSIKHPDKTRDKTPSRYSPTRTSHLRDQLAISWRRTSSAQKQEKARLPSYRDKRVRVPAGYRTKSRRVNTKEHAIVELHHQHEPSVATKTEIQRERERYHIGAPLLTRKHLELVILSQRSAGTPRCRRPDLRGSALTRKFA